MFSKKFNALGWQETGNVERYNRKPKAYKVHKEHVKFLLNEIRKNKTITMEDLQVKLNCLFLIWILQEGIFVELLETIILLWKLQE